MLEEQIYDENINVVKKIYLNTIKIVSSKYLKLLKICGLNYAGDLDHANLFLEHGGH